MAINIWMATWNCELMAPSNNVITNHFVVPDIAALNPGLQNNLPDLIVIALQEANPDANGNFVASRVAAATGYQVLAEDWYEGRTKGPCSTYMAVLRRAAPAAVAGAHGVVVAAPQFNVTNVTINHYRDTINPLNKIQTKGGVYATITVTKNHDPDVAGPGVQGTNGKRKFAFIGVHLDAADDASRRAAIKELLKKVTGNPPGADLSAQLKVQYDAVFFMGDLNYRLGRPGQNLVNGPYVTIGNPPAVPNIDMKHNIPHFQMCSIVNDNACRQTLATQMDSLQDSNLITDYQFTFPYPRQPGSNDISYPSYKLDYDSDLGRAYFHDLMQVGGYRFTFDKVDNPANPGIAANLNANAVTTAGRAQDQNERIKGCFFSDNGAPRAIYNTDRRQYDVGWLDRVGYVSRTANLPHLANFPDVVNVIECKPYYILLSDHLPVILKVACV